MNKHQITDINMHRFFKEYVWDFRTYPDEDVQQYFQKRKNAVLDLTEIAETPLFYDIRDIFVCVFANKEPYSYTSKAFPSMLYIADFMQNQGYENFACIKNAEKADIEWQEFWTNKGKKYLYDLRYVISNSYWALLEYRDERTGLDRNLWRFNDIKINKERIDKARVREQMNFWTIQNTDNRELVKVWFKYLLGGTELAYSTICSRFSLCQQFINYIGDKSLADVTNQDISDYREKRNLSATTNNHLMHDLEDMYRYLATKDLYDGKCPVVSTDYMPTPKEHHYNTVPDFTILEMFKHLHKLDETYLLIYLINLFTGNRITDICQLTTDCLYKNEHGYFLAHDIQKMQDNGGIPISKELYDLIQKRIRYVNSIDNGNNYLFPSIEDDNRPFVSDTYRRNMCQNVKDWGITLPNGKPYKFRTHAYRHTIATQLFKMGMPSSLIQLGILHHKEINMSRCYIDNDAEMELSILNTKGINAPSIISVVLTLENVFYELSTNV